MAGLLLLSYSFFFVSEEYFGESFLRFGVVLPCIGAALILLPNQQGGWVDKLLCSKPTVAIGKVSYSLYLYHWPIIVFYKLYTGEHELSFLASTGIVLLAFILATFSYFLVERPLRKSNLPDRQVIYAALKASKPASASASAAEIAGLLQIKRETLQFTTPTLDRAAIGQLLTMTPHLYRASSDGKVRAAALEQLQLTVDVVISVLQADPRE